MSARAAMRATVASRQPCSLAYTSAAARIRARVSLDFAYPERFRVPRVESGWVVTEEILNAFSDSGKIAGCRASNAPPI